MVLGQSSATAAAIAIKENQTVQSVNYEALAERLTSDGQVLEYVGPKRIPGVDPASLSGTVVDNTDATTRGPWVTSSSSSSRVGFDYLHDNHDNKGECIAMYDTTLPAAGRYRVVLRWPPHPNRATNTRVIVFDATGKRHQKTVDQRDPESKGRAELGIFDFSDRAKVEITNVDSDGYVIADAVQFGAVD